MPVRLRQYSLAIVMLIEVLFFLSATLFLSSGANQELFIVCMCLALGCTHHLRNKFTAAPDSPERRKISASVYDLVEFLHDVLQVREFPGTEFKHKVALHTSCSAI